MAFKSQVEIIKLNLKKKTDYKMMLTCEKFKPNRSENMHWLIRGVCRIYRIKLPQVIRGIWPS